MSNNDEETEETERGKIITVKHEFSGLSTKGNKGKAESPEEVEQLKKDLKEKTEILSLIALKEFEGDKEKLLEVVPEDKREEISEFVDSPEKIRDIA